MKYNSEVIKINCTEDYLTAVKAYLDGKSEIFLLYQKAKRLLKYAIKGLL